MNKNLSYLCNPQAIERVVTPEDVSEILNHAKIYSLVVDEKKDMLITKGFRKDAFLYISCYEDGVLLEDEEFILFPHKAEPYPCKCMHYLNAVNANSYDRYPESFSALVYSIASSCSCSDNCSMVNGCNLMQSMKAISEFLANVDLKLRSACPQFNKFKLNFDNYIIDCEMAALSIFYNGLDSLTELYMSEMI